MSFEKGEQMEFGEEPKEKPKIYPADKCKPCSDLDVPCIECARGRTYINKMTPEEKWGNTFKKRR